MPYSFEKKVSWDRFDLPNIPLFSTKLPKNITNKLWEYIEKAKENPENNNSSLAGNISTSLYLNDEDDFLMKNLLDPVIKNYLDPTKVGLKWNSGIRVNSHAHKNYVLNGLWVNFQKQTEFNPLHNHSGVLSFVIWLKIPTNWAEQHDLPISKNSNTPSASDFQLVYTDILGCVATYNVMMGKNIENVILVFPSQLKHLVYPFYNCDQDRISISGNISLDSTQYTKWG